MKILFVDDESNVLDGLRRTLRAMRQEWEMSFAGGGREALELMAREPFEVVVSDMRMPEMNGVQLLTEVMERYPEAIRIILSGYADESLIARSAGIAHQFLAKPCDCDQLAATVKSAVALRELLAGGALRRLISQIGTLPSLPSLYLEIVKELRAPDPSLRRVGEIIARDLGMTAKVLQLVNSAFFGLRRRVANAVEAASYLGLETIQSLVLSLHAFSQFDPAAAGALSADRLWSHSMRTARLAKRISESEGDTKGAGDEALTAGLLHDLGRLVLACRLPEQYGPILAGAGCDEGRLCTLEMENLGATHAEVGAYLLGLWGLPDTIVEIVAYHHRPKEKGPAHCLSLACVHAADALEAEARNGGGAEMRAYLDHDWLAGANLAQRLASWRAVSSEVFSG